MRKIFTAIDIGSNSIKIVVGEFYNGHLNILCVVNNESKGFKYGEITDKNMLISCLKESLSEVEKKINFKTKKIILNIPTSYNEFKVVENKLDITAEDKRVTSGDISKIIQTSSINQINPNEELIACIPIMFKIKEDETLTPCGMEGDNLSLKSVLVSTDKKRIYDLLKIIAECELEIVDITTTSLVDYYNFKEEELDKKNIVTINLGDTSTNVAIFSKGVFINNETNDIGGLDIDKEIAITYDLRKKDAKYLKEKLSFASMKYASENDFLTVSTKEGNQIDINSEEISSIVIKKIEEILKVAKKSINHLTKKEISYIIITGGLSEIKGIEEIVNGIFKSKGKIGDINTIGIRNNSYSVAIGMLKYFYEKLVLRNKEYSFVDDNDIELMCSNNSKMLLANDSIIGKVFSYFFDN